MRILIDECLDWRLARALPGHTVSSAQHMGWSGIKNGQLLSLAESQFDVFITGDRNLSFQQNIPKLNLVVFVLSAKSTRLQDTLPLMSKVLTLLSTVQPGSVTRISGP